MSLSVEIITFHNVDLDNWADILASKFVVKKHIRGGTVAISISHLNSACYIWQSNFDIEGSNFGPDANYFNIRYRELSFLNQVIFCIESCLDIWIETDANFHMYGKEYIEKTIQYPNWRWDDSKWWNSSLDEVNYLDPLVWDHTEYKEDNLSIEPIYPDTITIFPGKFTFNCEAIYGEKRSYEINIPKIFNVGKYPITFSEYDQFCQATKRPFPRDLDWGRVNRPVIQVSWKEALAYCEWLSKRSGKMYRLPSELEWEYVAKKGLLNHEYIQTLLPNQKQYHSSKTESVGYFGANNLGVYDMLSNIWEWTLDYDHDTCKNMNLDASPWEEIDVEEAIFPDYIEMYRVVRGGGWLNKNKIQCATLRNSFDYMRGYPCVGFRVLEEINA